MLSGMRMVSVECVSCALWPLSRSSAVGSLGQFLAPERLASAGFQTIRLSSSSDHIASRLHLCWGLGVLLVPVTVIVIVTYRCPVPRPDVSSLLAVISWCTVHDFLVYGSCWHLPSLRSPYLMAFCHHLSHGQFMVGGAPDMGNLW